MYDWNWRRMRERYRLAAAAPRPDARFVSRWTTVDGVDIHCRTTRDDPPGKAPVLLVHGMAVSHRYLMPLAALLADRYPVRAVDLPGFGLSGEPGAVLGVPALADRLAAWVEATGEAPAALVANSFGTQISVALAARHPHLVRSLVLVGPTMDPAARTRPRQALRWLRGLPYEDPSQLPIILRDLADAGLRRAWRTFGIALEHHVEYDLPKVRVPTLVTRGAKEAVATQRWVREVVRLLPHGEMAVIPGSPHDATYTTPVELAELVLPFLDRTPAEP
ncbi:alpha/beta hydrolase [Glycomyces sp. TRM65418]|uniref:alpha/beta fold hydrolase n=1 Tax=Glycomyces sp. TRM65418 TaxID=2867006 RepID=UPI001CE6B441|nr:alpha/beta hydrolase [Glycomyces sp. TRM65418]MCC3765325.1 alpha/beta hydrolase [Glycomyces sp. TRM65418]QZD54942.1 alpha/beta hydrolase [Glycomyces sp. TRM65418]